MFELEILELLKKLKNTSDQYEVKKLKSSLCNLIKQNPDKYQNFIRMQALDSQTLKLFDDCERIETEEDKNKTNELNDIEIIKNNYLKWLEIYQNNQNTVNFQNEKIIQDIIDFYVKNRIEVLFQVFKIEQDENFEAFKNMLKNYLRKYFGEKIESYLSSETYNSKGFFEKKRKDKEVLILIEMIGKYDFNITKINEVLK